MKKQQFWTKWGREEAFSFPATENCFVTGTE